MENGEAARVALAVGVLVDWIARTDERLYKLEQALGLSRAEADTDMFPKLVERVEQLENNQEILRRFTRGL